MKNLKVLALGISVSVAFFVIVGAVAIIKNDDLGVLQSSTPAAEVTVSSGVPSVAALAPTPAPPPIATSTPTPLPPAPPTPTVVPPEVRFEEGIGYSMDAGVVSKSSS